MSPALAFALLLAAPRASAALERGPLVQVELDPCVEIDAAALEVQLSLEFGPPVGVEVGALGEASDVGVSPAERSSLIVACGVQGLRLSLDDGLTDKTMARDLDLAPGGGEWERRALALAIVEFVRASWLELELHDEPEPEPEPAPPEPKERELAPSPAAVRVAKQRASGPRRPWLIALGPRAELLSSERVFMGGGQLRVLHQPRRVLAWTLAAGAAHGRPRLALGRLALTEAWLAPALLAVLQRPRYGLAGGAGLRVGFSHIQGLPAAEVAFTGRSFTRGISSAFALTRAQLELPARRRLALALELELGWVLRPVTALAGEDVVFAREGLWVAASASLAFGL